MGGTCDYFSENHGGHAPPWLHMGSQQKRFDSRMNPVIVCLRVGGLSCWVVQFITGRGSSI
jgi:hypothetical protein